MVSVNRLFALLVLSLPVAAFAQDPPADDPPPDEAPPAADSAPDVSPPEAVTSEATTDEGAVPSPPGDVEAVPPQMDAEPPPPPPEALPDDVDTLYRGGYSRFAAGDLSGAEQWLEAALAREPDHEGARGYLIETKLLLGKDDEAASLRAGEPLVVEPEPEPQPEDPDVRKRRLNPRAFDKATVGLGIAGPVVSVGVYAALEPSWFFSLKGGAGIGIGTAGAVFAEAQLLPVPFRLTPLVGVGATALLGPGAWRIDSRMAGAAPARNVRLVPYGLLGLRYDALKPLSVEGFVGVAPAARVGYGLIGYGGVRIGWRF